MACTSPAVEEEYDKWSGWYLHLAILVREVQTLCLNLHSRLSGLGTSGQF